jgi:hypothetical protein
MDVDERSRVSKFRIAHKAGVAFGVERLAMTQNSGSAFGHYPENLLEASLTSQNAVKTARVSPILMLGAPGGKLWGEGGPPSCNALGFEGRQYESKQVRKVGGNCDQRLRCRC